MQDGNPFKVIRYIVNGELVQVSFQYQCLVMLFTDFWSFFAKGEG